MAIAGVYEIQNIINGHRYIGSSSNISRRLSSHRYMLNLDKHPNSHLQGAWNMYGAENFVFSVLIYCDPEMTIVYEQEYFDKLKPEYNFSKYAEAPTRGLKFSEERCRQMSEITKSNMTDEMRQKIREKLSGRKLPESQKQNIGNALRGHNHSREHNKNVSVALMGHSFTDEVREKMSESQKRRFERMPITDEFRQSRSNAANIRWAKERGEL